MRVLIVSQYFWPENFPINAIVANLVERGIDVEVLTGKPNYPEGKISSGYRIWGCQQEQWKGATVHRVPLFPRGKKSHLRLIVNYFSFIFFGIFNGSWLLRKRQYDVIFVYAPSPILLALPALFIGWLKNKKVIIWVQDLWPESLSATGYINNRFIIRIVRQVVRYIYKHADLLLMQSRAFKEPIRALAPNTPIIYHPNSVDNIFSKPVKNSPSQFKALEEGFSVMFAGNIGAAQAVDVIVKAASLLKKYDDINFVIIGDGSSRDWLLQEVKKFALTNINLPGRLPIEMMPGFMYKASVLLVTLSDRAIFAATVPSKIQAYMAVGKPIIACLNGEGARLVVEAEAGLATPAENAHALAETILQLYRQSPNERKNMGDNGRRYYEKHFDQEYLLDQLIKHLRSTCKFKKNSL